MNEQEVDRQINQMVQFIKQEAEEKANEIRVAAEEVGSRVPPSQGSVPTIRDVPLEEVCRVLFRTPGGDRRVRRRAPEAELAG
jgi:hypothetical protein